jgi:hypothetical protein
MQSFITAKNCNQIHRSKVWNGSYQGLEGREKYRVANQEAQSFTRKRQKSSGELLYSTIPTANNNGMYTENFKRADLTLSDFTTIKKLKFAKM